jgi:hypothetical protein
MFGDDRSKFKLIHYQLSLSLGHKPRLTDAQAALSTAWELWLRWAGLRQDQPLRWSSR